MVEQNAQLQSETYVYWAKQRATNLRTLEDPYHELRGDSVSQRRRVQIDNLIFRLSHAAELELTDKKIERMKIALQFQETAQVRDLTSSIQT